MKALTVTTAVWRLTGKQDGHKFKTTLSYIVSSRLAQAKEYSIAFVLFCFLNGRTEDFVLRVRNVNVA